VARVFLFAAASKPALRPTQPTIKWVLGVKRLGREADYSLPSCAEVKNAWISTSIPTYVFVEWHLVKHRDNFTAHKFSGSAVGSGEDHVGFQYYSHVCSVIANIIFKKLNPQS
jgi:hypothetical protein